MKKTSIHTTVPPTRMRKAAAFFPDLDVAIIGAGPYGLSAGAHLQAKGLGVQIFGQPMDFWATQMPAGMLLRSPRAASSIADPRGALTLEAYEAAHGLAPAVRVPLETFVNYGMWFRHQLGPVLRLTHVTQVTRDESRFRLTLQNGETVTSRRVVVAAGIGAFARKPKIFAELPNELVSHCYEGVRVDRFAGRKVAVIGAGQSALECAALLNEAGASVELIARIPELRWISNYKWLHQMGPLTRMLYSKHDVGPIGISRLVAYPEIVSRFPMPLKDKIRTRAVRSAGSQWLRPRMSGIMVRNSRYATAATEVHHQVKVRLDDDSSHTYDHVLLGTGYQVDISKYDFLSNDMLAGIRQLDGYPALRPGFESSISGLHFIGAAAARTFGPLVYFVTGTEFASSRLAKYVSQAMASARL
jgi:thioredoxin reductase